MRSPGVFMRWADVFMRRTDVFMRRADVFIRWADVFIRSPGVFMRRTDVFMRRVGVFIRRVGVFMRVPCVQRTPRRGKSSQPRASERSDATPWVSRRAVRYAPTGQKQRQGRSKLPGGRGGGRKTGPPPWSAGITGAAGMVGGRLWGEGARGGSGKMRREGAGHYHSSAGHYHSSAGRYHSSPNDFSSPNCSP